MSPIFVKHSTLCKEENMPAESKHKDLGITGMICFWKHTAAFSRNTAKKHSLLFILKKYIKHVFLTYKVYDKLNEVYYIIHKSILYVK